MSKRFHNILIGSCLTLLALTSCEHKELCFNHDEHAPKTQTAVLISYEQEWQYRNEGTDWKENTEWQNLFGVTYNELYPDIPEGIRVQTFEKKGGNNIFNIAPYGEIINLREGTHDMLFYNNDTEYIVFDNIDVFAKAKATTRTRSRSTYIGNQFSGSEKENTVNPPDMLYGNYIESYTTVRKKGIDSLEVMMHPLVFKYLIFYEFEAGLEYVALARGALAGMADAVYLNSGHTSEKEATILFNCEVKPNGVQTITQSFGIPDYPNPQYARGPGKYALNLEVMLKNGKIKSFNFDVTDQVAVQPQGGIIFVSGIKIDKEEGEAGGAGFDVDVDDWGEYEDVEIPL